MPPDPRKQECLGSYLYGAGYFARDENTLSIITGQKSPPHFCLTCIARDRCEDEHEQVVRETQPEAVEIFDRRMQAGILKGVGATTAAAYLASRGADPFAAAAVENFKQGHADRGERLIQ